MRRLAPILAALALFAVAFFLASSSLAQTVQVTGIVPRYYSDGVTGAPVRSQNQNPTGINLTDCLGNDNKGIVLGFSLTTSGATSASILQAWAGTSDCTPLLSRSGTAPTCWPVLPNSIAPATITSASIRAQDIVSQLSSTTKTLTYAPADATTCSQASAATVATISLYFIWVDAGGNPVGTAAVYPIKVKLAGPPAPTGVSAGQGDTLLIVGWSSQIDPDTQGFTVYMDPPPGSTSPSDASSPADAAPQLVTTCVDGGPADGGVDDSGLPVDAGFLDGGCTTKLVYPNADGGGASTCSSTVLVEGAVAANLGAYAVTTLGGSTSTSATVTGLTNFTSYTVAVGATDSFANVGPLSAPACAAPVPVDDFWKLYRGDGGQAGGGFCALEGPGMPARAGVFALAMIFVAAAFGRRRLRR